MEAVQKFDNNSLDFVYIDADHSYETTLEDITEWTKKVKPGGIVSGDDYTTRNQSDRYDVLRAINDYGESHNIDELFVYKGGRRPPSWMFRK